jgi:hypothetical protein
MDDPYNQIKPVKNCPKCGAPVTMDILYSTPGAYGFEELCTKCSWSRKSSFTEEGCTTKENW